MIVHIEICDVCRRIVRSNNVDRYSLGDGLEKFIDVCPGCDKTPFKTEHAVWHQAATSRLLPRIEALIMSELSIMKDPV